MEGSAGIGLVIISYNPSVVNYIIQKEVGHFSGINLLGW